MPQVTDGMFKLVIIGAVFLVVWGAFNALFIGEQIGSGDNISYDDILSAGWDIFTQPELIFFNLMFGAVFVVGLVIVVREMLPV